MGVTGSTAARGLLDHPERRTTGGALMVASILIAIVCILALAGCGEHREDPVD